MTDAPEPETTTASSVSLLERAVKLISFVAAAATASGGVWMLGVAIVFAPVIPALTLCVGFVATVALTVAGVAAIACLYGDCDRAAGLLCAMVLYRHRDNRSRFKRLRTSAMYIGKFGFAAACLSILYCVLEAFEFGRGAPSSEIPAIAFFLCLAETGLLTMRVASAMERQVKSTSI